MAVAKSLNEVFYRNFKTYYSCDINMPNLTPAHSYGAATSGLYLSCRQGYLGTISLLELFELDVKFVQLISHFSFALGTSRRNNVFDHTNLHLYFIDGLGYVIHHFLFSQVTP